MHFGLENMAIQNQIMHGKFSLPNFPHTGWRLIADWELEEDETHLCQACERKRIHFVCKVEHPNWSVPIEIGVDCLEQLTGQKHKHAGQLRSRDKRRLKTIAEKWDYYNGRYTLTWDRKTAHLREEEGRWVLGFKPTMKNHHITGFPVITYYEQREFSTPEEAVDYLHQEWWG